jgi:hypothetical protein
LVGLREDEQDFVSLLYLGFHPLAPTLFPIEHILIDPGIDPISAKVSAKASMRCMCSEES